MAFFWNLTAHSWLFLSVDKEGHLLFNKISSCVFSHCTHGAINYVHIWEPIFSWTVFCSASLCTWSLQQQLETNKSLIFTTGSHNKNGIYVHGTSESRPQFLAMSILLLAKVKLFFQIAGYIVWIHCCTHSDPSSYILSLMKISANRCLIDVIPTIEIFSPLHPDQI